MILRPHQIRALQRPIKRPSVVLYQVGQLRKRFVEGSSAGARETNDFVDALSELVKISDERSRELMRQKHPPMPTGEQLREQASRVIRWLL
jgi:hypothetical protein